MSRVKKSLHILSNTFYYLPGVFLCTYTLIAFANVIARYVFHNSFSWTEEIVLLLFVLGIYLSQIELEKKDQQLSVSFLVSKFKNKYLLITLRTFQRLLVAGLFIVLGRELIIVTARNYHMGTTTTVLGIPFWPEYLIVALVMFAVALINIGKAIWLFASSKYTSS